MKNTRFYVHLGLLASLLLFASLETVAQTTGGIYVDPNRGAKANRKQLKMDANKVESIIENKGTFGKVNERNYSGAWPRGSGHSHVHEMSILTSAAVLGPAGDTLRISSESYDVNPDRSTTGVDYFWNPLPGYANDHRRLLNKATGKWDTESQIANSMDSSTYPSSWPGKDATWNKRWNGYFGKDQFNADQEALYVIDDSYNSEYPFYPKAADTTWRGLGLQVETRLFQWSHPLAENQIFIHFQVTNVSDYDYDRNIYFGAFADTHPGGLGDVDDNSGYDQAQNMVFAWDNDDGVEQWTSRQDIKPGYVAWKYLESPGFSDDGIDNDRDGLFDEKRDNDAGSYVLGPIGNYGPAKWHWTGDEDGDWDPNSDDVGTDGVGPLDGAWTGPDPDGTEGNNKPDQGEPNFGKTDKDESDQIGLTSFYSPAYGTVDASDDPRIWNYIQPGRFETPAQNSNNMWIFASGPFRLPRLKTERFSVCWLFGYTRQEVYRNAETSQQIYNNDYRFTKAPGAPVVTAVPGDKRVTLYWNDAAERSRDPIYGFDFEGYRIYRGTNPELTEASVITDAFGAQSYKLPIAQYDVKDGVKGLHPLALGTEIGEQFSKGIHYYMGDDTGLRHYFVDSNDVVNGMTYYYVVVAYDKGYYKGMDDRNLIETTPSESPYRPPVETYGLIQAPSSNVGVVTPNAPATDYQAGKVNSMVTHAGPAFPTGSVTVNVVDPDLLPNAHVFEVSFASSVAGVDSGLGVPFATSYSVRDTTSGSLIVQNEAIPFQYIPPDSNLGARKPLPWQTYDTLWSTKIFSGMAMNFRNTLPSQAAINTSSGWEPGSQTNAVVGIDYGDAVPIMYPVSFDVEITKDISGKSLTNKGVTSTFDTYFRVVNAVTREPLTCYLQEKLISKNGKWDKSENLYIGMPKGDGTTMWPWMLSWIGYPETVAPAPGDVFHFVSPVPFTASDKFYFSTAASTRTSGTTNSLLGKVAVVPNPYLLTAEWEQASSSNGRGQRKIMFIHLPAECTIRIFTQNAVLLKTIHHSGSMADGTESWDLTSNEGLEVAFGVYVFHVEAPGAGSKIGTFAIIN